MTPLPIVLLLLAAVPHTADDPLVEMYFEIKLLVRGQFLTQKTVADQWARGRLLMRAVPVDDPPNASAQFELVRPLEDPWTFRWYDNKDEVKLGAAISVPEPSGDPYHDLARRLEPLARLRYEQWWDADVVESTSPERPHWAAKVDRFWSEQHERETSRKDPLHEEATYPFHVLGDPAGRFRATATVAGELGAISEQMSTPWLPHGWSDWLNGERRTGYGYWDDTERPDWEPRTYQAFAEALHLLFWSCLPDGDPDTLREWGEGATYEVEVGTRIDPFTGRLAYVAEALNPRVGGKLDWAGRSKPSKRNPEGATVIFALVAKSSEHTELTGVSGRLTPEKNPELRYRIWRHARYDHPARRLDRDEIQVLVEHRENKLKLWIKTGFRPYNNP